MPKPPGDRLEEYRTKRAADRTPEPFGGSASARPRVFVVQRHAATNLHYDLRLEYEGVLLSWAVPKGPSADPAVKRLAMQTEDHPVEYADFEGVIPEGNYGAGQVTVWDQGCWVPLEDFAEGLEKGKLLFELRGHKLGGAWTLFRTSRRDGNPREWLLMKKPDAYAHEGEDPWPDTSIFSGLLVEELRDGAPRVEAVGEEIAAAAAEGRVDGAAQRPMLARSDDAAFEDDGWVFEFKLDGYRLLLEKDFDQVKLYYRSGREATSLYPELVRSARRLPYDHLVLDGELVIHDDEGRPSFQRLQSRAQLSRRNEIELATVLRPALMFCFDLLGVDDFDLRDLPLVERKAFLRRILPDTGPLRYSDHIAAHGKAVYEQARGLGLEGVVAKRAGSRYRAGRGDDWRKIKAEQTGDFAIVGWTTPKGARSGFGALHLAAREGGELVYIGRVGTGFSDRQLAEIAELIQPMEREGPPCTGPVPQTRGHHWVDPTIVAEVRYLMRTDDGMLRHPAFLRLRDDKAVEDCVAPPMRDAEPAAPEMLEAEAHSFEPTNLDKVFWPDEGYTKGDLLEYYGAIAPYMLPFLRERPVVLVRYPDGVNGKSFFQKDAPKWVPDWLRTERMWSEQTQRDIDYFVCDDEASLLFLANLGTIPFHIWSSRVTDPAMPDWCVLDLDPKGAPFEDVIEVARAIRGLCDRIELEAFLKTSGSTGLHVLVPLGGQCTYEQSRSFGELVARVIENELPKIATTARAVRKREGRVYIDYIQNGPGRLIVAPYSVRPRPGATVSAPLRWTDLDQPDLSIEQFTMKTLPAHMKELGEDPLRPLLDAEPDLMGALQRLSALL